MYIGTHFIFREQFPCYSTQILNDHMDQVWFCRFSPDGKYLATGCKGGTMIIWEVNMVSTALLLIISEVFVLEKAKYIYFLLMWCQEFI